MNPSPSSLHAVSQKKKISALLAVAGAAVMLCACGGIRANYPSYAIAPVEDIEVIPVTAEWIRLQKKPAPVEAAEAALPPSLLGTRDYSYRIGPGDILGVDVPDIVTLNMPTAPNIVSSREQAYVVHSDGTTFVPFAGVVSVGGLTVQQAQARIVDALSRYMRSPEVVVSVAQFRSQRVLVTGQVERPGYQPVTDVPLSVIGALSAAGGVADLRANLDPRLIAAGSVTYNQVQPEYPDLGHVRLNRGDREYVIDVRELLKQGALEQDVLLLDGDVLVVPPVERGNLFVLGEVGRPALLEIAPHDTSLAQALMATGGVDRVTSNPSRIYVIRGDFNRPTIYQVDASAPDALLLAQSFPVQPQDVVFVSETAVTRWNRVLSQILPSLQGLVSTAVIVDTADDVSN